MWVHAKTAIVDYNLPVADFGKFAEAKNDHLYALLANSLNQKLQLIVVNFAIESKPSRVILN